MKILIIFFLLCSVCYAGENELNGVKFIFDDKYSGKDYTTQTLRDVKDLNSMTIYATCFSKETPDTKVFPDDMTGVTFINCNLMNVFIPAGNTVIGGQTTKFSAQADGEDWVLDKDNKVIEPLEKERFIKEGKSIDPKDIKAK